jgi:signal transduction histidine kinase
MTRLPGSALGWALAVAVGCLASSSVSWTLSWLALPVTAYLLLRLSARSRARDSAVGLATALVAAASTGIPPSRGTGAVLPFAMVLVLAWAIGVSLARQQERATKRLVERARAAEAAAEGTRADLAEQRLAMARDLHDVVAHHLTVMTVQAGYGALVGPDNPAAAVAALEVVAGTGRGALDELRGLVGVLRADASAAQPADTRPVPGLADLDVLVNNAALAGVHVDVRVIGKPHPVAPVVGLAAYRIVQEALTNVVRHAAANRAEIGLQYAEGQLVLHIRDAGVGAASSVTGNGLRGMGERAAACGGNVVTGPAPSGGFGVVATLPLAEAPATLA